MKSLGNFLFKYRSYTPLPFVFLMILFMNPTVATILAGLAFVIFGEFIRVWSVSYAGSETRTTEGVGGSNLVTQGPYSIIRNPLYFGNISIYIGIGIMSNAMFPFLTIVAFLFFTFQYYLIIFNEEDYLRSAYGSSFELYCKTLKRFLPLPKSMPEEIRSHLPLDIKDGFRSEKRSLQAVTIITIIILIKFFFL
ncbi:MAG: isoprenylcysteine carboxylmethyltransferase family protein [Bacteroidetes bacterium]|nr:isoprenylcysteine carboxylmethyltransferase family protein [Bacteroidota bacterium]